MTFPQPGPLPRTGGWDTHAGERGPDRLVGILDGLADADQLVGVVTRPAQPARTAATARPLPAAMTSAVPPEGLWSHQAQALDLALSGKSVALATGTASGKSLCYQLAVAAAMAGDPAATAIVLHPTKALARDQLRSWSRVAPGPVVAVYDGDSSPDERAWVRRHARVVITNPEMLHVGILPNHGRWAPLLSGLRYVVVDELHVLRGVFGSHVAHVLRRLRRLADSYGAHPTFIFTSATIGQPGQLAQALAGLPVTEILEDGSPQGERLLGLWQPPLIDRRRGRRASAHGETARVLAGLVSAGLRTIAFTRSRAGAEVVAAAANRQLPPALAGTVRAYRGGYLPADRRAIESDMTAGRLRGLAATSALELGIDIGDLDACVLDGFPGTLASLWQRAGRAGRRAQAALTVLVAGADALDQWWMTHPDQLLSRPPEPAVVTPSNPHVLHPHLACAAWEAPLEQPDDVWWGPPGLGTGAFEEAVAALVRDDRLVLREARAVYAGRQAPAPAISLRAGSVVPWWIAHEETAEILGTTEEGRVFPTLHPGAVYLHQGVRYRVGRLDLEDRVAYVSETDDDEFTQARSETTVTLLGEEQTCTVGRASLSLGPVEVVEQVTGYRRRSAATGETLDEVALELPRTHLETRALWYVLSDVTVADALGPDGPGDRANGPPSGREPSARVAGNLHTLGRVAGSLHALEHAAIGVLPLFAICDRSDVGGFSSPWLPGTQAPTVMIYDGWPGGAGLADLGYGAASRHLAATLDVLNTCPCQDGCPSCVQSPKCGNLNEPLDKSGAAALLRAVLGLAP